MQNICLKMHTYIVHPLDYLFKLSCACHQATASTLMRGIKEHTLQSVIMMFNISFHLSVSESD